MKTGFHTIFKAHVVLLFFIYIFYYLYFLLFNGVPFAGGLVEPKFLHGGNNYTNILEALYSLYLPFLW